MMTKLLLSLSLLLLAAEVRGDLYDVPQTTTVMNKSYSLKHDITLTGGYMAMDPFTKYFVFGGSYAYSFNDFIAWEAIHGLAMMPMKTSLRKDLVEGGFTQESSFQDQTYIVTSNLIFSPLYTKNLFFNSSVVHSQMSLVAGGGSTSFSGSSIICADVGLILRYFLSETFSVKLDIRNYFYFGNTTDSVKADIRNNLTINLGLSLNFGASGLEYDASEFEE